MVIQFAAQSFPTINEPAALCADGTIRRAEPGDPVIGIMLRREGEYAQVLVGGGMPDFGVQRSTPMLSAPPLSCHYCGAPSPGEQCRYCNTVHWRTT